MTEPRKSKIKVLTRLKINEVSLCDRGAGHGCKVIISKRADDADDNPVELSAEEIARAKAEGRMAIRDQEDIEKREYERIHGTGHADHGPADDEDENPFLKYFRGMKVSESAGRAMAKVAADLRKGNDADAEDDGLKRDGREAIADQVEDALDQDSDGKPVADGSNDHPAHKAAHLLVQSGSHKTHEDALAYLLHNPRGAALLRRLSKQHEDQPMTTPDLQAIAKREGVHVICKIMVADQRSYGITQDELVDLISNHERQDGESAAKCFSRHYEADTADGLALRKAVEITKSAPLQDDSAAEAEKDAEAACRELQKIGDERWPSLTLAQRFARAAECNPQILKRAHRRPSPISTFPFPRG